MAAILWDDTDTGRLFGIGTVRKMLRKLKSPSEITRRIVGKTLLVNLIYAVSLMERTDGYGPSNMGSTPVLRASEGVGCILIGTTGQ